LETVIKGLKTQNKILSSTNATMVSKIERINKMPANENTDANSNVKIVERFFMVIDMLIAVKAMRGNQSFTKKYEINLQNFRFVRENPRSKMFQPIWISNLMEDFGISAEWIMTGKGKMFNDDLFLLIGFNKP